VLRIFHHIVADFELASQAVAEMVRRLRKLRSHCETFNGLVLANGGGLATENAICLSTQPHKSHKSYPLEDKMPVNVAAPTIVSTVEKEEEAVIEVRIPAFMIPLL
jgi:putative AlgH/UPF0301 family transcriptional regulator